MAAAAACVRAMGWGRETIAVSESETRLGLACVCRQDCRAKFVQGGSTGTEWVVLRNLRHMDLTRISRAV